MSTSLDIVQASQNLVFFKVSIMYLYYFSKLYCFSCICANTLYRYRFPVFISILYIGTNFLVSIMIFLAVLFSCIVIYVSDIYYAYYLICYHLTPNFCMLSPNICLISLITCHLIHYYLPCDYHISGILSSYPVLYTVTYIVSTYVLLLLL